MSRVEKAALTVKFDPKVTIVIGENDTGKSSLIKSIYWTLGADPAVTHPRWKDADVIGMLDFVVDQAKYTIVRNRGRFGIFDEGKRLLLATSKITKELSPYLAELFGFKLMLLGRDQIPQVPPPAFCFLPFYVDQDVGWQQPWQSFANLQQFPNFKKDVISYHSGIRPNEYYDLKTQANSYKSERSTQVTNRNVLQGAADKLKTESALDGIGLDQEEYKEAIHHLLAELKVLRDKRQRYASSLAELVSERTSIDEQYKVARRALAEFDKDLRWLNEQDDDTIQCPICGTEHTNSFAQRFGIVEDRETCRSFVLQTIDKIDSIRLEVDKAQDALRSVDKEISSINEALNTKKGELALHDVLVSEGQRQARYIFDSEIEGLNASIAKFDTDIAELERQIKGLEDKKRKKTIEQFYAQKVTSNLQKLDVRTIRARDIEKIDGRIRDTGSDQPRAVLAYDLAFLSTLKEFSSSVMAPIVIDSPNQQDQDSKNAKAMMELIFSEISQDSQLILGTVSLHGQPTIGTTIRLKDKLKLLKKSQYPAVDRVLSPLLDKMF